VNRASRLTQQRLTTVLRSLGSTTSSATRSSTAQFTCKPARILLQPSLDTSAGGRVVVAARCCVLAPSQLLIPGVSWREWWHQTKETTQSSWPAE